MMPFVRNKNIFLVLAVVVISALSLSACTSPEPNEEDTLQLNFGGPEESQNSQIPPEPVQPGDLGDLSTSPNNQGSQGDQNNQANQPNNNLPNQGQTMQEKSQKTLADFKAIKAKTATLKTNKGNIVIELFTDKSPLTTTNFLNLISEGFYNGIIFHRVEPGFVVQFGDPNTKIPGNEDLWGTGSPGYTIADEFGSGLSHDSAGIVSMANSGPNTGGSQLFITLDATPFLDGKHTILGKVTSGMDVVNKIQVGDKIESASFQ